MSTVSVLTRSRRLIAGLTAIAALAAGSVVVSSVASPGRVLALPGASESTVVTVEPTRVLDTRFDVGLTGVFQAGVSRKLAVTGDVVTYFEPTKTRTTKTVVPAGATGVLLNVTGFAPTARGWIAVRPGDATGLPSTSNLNLLPGQVVPNAVTVAVPTSGSSAGQIDITYGPPSGGNVNIIVDIVGYTTNTGLIDLVNRVAALETAGVKGDKGDPGPRGAAGKDGDPGADGQNGVAGKDGDPGADGQNGVDGKDGDPGADGKDGVDGKDGDPGADGKDGVDAESPARVIWVADDGTGDFTLLSAALASITDASASKPYVIKIAPGQYTEESSVLLQSFVDIEGSGWGTTTITCACGGGFPSSVLSGFSVTAQLRDLSIVNTGGGAFSTGVNIDGAALSMVDVVVTASGGATDNYGVYAQGGTPLLDGVTATATGPQGRGVFNNSGASATIRNSTLSGPTSIFNFGGSSVEVSDSGLDGPIVGSGFTCVAVRTTSGVQLDAGCLADVPLCTGTYFMDRKSFPVATPESFDQRFELWSFASDGTFQGRSSMVRSLASEPFLGVPGVGLQGSWAAESDGSISIVYFLLDDFVEMGQIYRYDVSAEFSGDCASLGSVVMTLRGYDPLTESPLDPSDGTAYSQGNTISGELVAVP